MTEAPPPPIAVIKVGGSLLDWPPLPDRLAAHLASRPGVRPVLIVGGGAMADVLRGLDRAHGLGDSRSHELALRVLDVSAALLAALLPGSRVATTLEELPAIWSAPLVPILAPRRVLHDDDRDSPLGALPHTWSTTTDSIAARVTLLLDSSDLTLLKSTPAPSRDLKTLTDLGWIDPEFARVSAQLSSVRLICLRGHPPVGPD